MKTIEVKQLDANSVWYEGRTMLRVSIGDDISNQKSQIVMDWSEGRQLVIECLTALSLFGLDPVAQTLVQFLVESAREIERRSEE